MRRRSRARAARRCDAGAHQRLAVGVERRQRRQSARSAAGCQDVGVFVREVAADLQEMKHGMW